MHAVRRSVLSGVNWELEKVCNASVDKRNLANQLIW